MIIASGGMKVWLDEQIESGQAMLNKFVAKLHNDEGEIVTPDVASFAFEWSRDEIVVMSECKVYVGVLSSYNAAKDPNKGDGVKSDFEWLSFLQSHATDILMNRASSVASRSTSPTGSLAELAETQAWAKVLDACKWSTMELGDFENFPIEE